MVTGHIGFIRGMSYILAQICGAAFGILMVVGVGKLCLIAGLALDGTLTTLAPVVMCRQGFCQPHMLAWETMELAVSILALAFLWVSR